MSLKHHNAKAAGTAPAMTPSQLAHELNNLLDGSIRHVGMVIRELQHLDTDPDLQDQLAQRLRTADQSMHLMADVIERYANPPAPGSAPGSVPAPGIASDLDSAHASEQAAPSPVELFRARGSLLDVFTHAVNVYGPVIKEQHIELSTRLDSAVADLPAGPVYTVLANALNNAIQSIQRCDANDALPHRIELRITPTDHDVVVKITDTGVGVDPVLFDPRGAFRFGVTTRRNGHGIGLTVCRQIAQDLGGQLQLSANPAGRGTQLTLQYPHPTQTMHHHDHPGVEFPGGGSEDGSEERLAG